MLRDILQRGVHFLKNISRKIRKEYDTSASRAIHTAGISGLGNLFIGTGKILSGILSLSMFVCINGCYTMGMVTARYCALAGAVRSQDKKTQYRHYRWSGIILIIASLLYIAYSVKLYFHPVYTAYHEYIALAIATFTFAEIGINLRGILVFRKSRSPLLEAIKIINLSSSLISLVLTQAAILSFSGESHDMSNNGILGALMGGCAALLGMYMLFRIRGLENPSECRSEKKRIKKLLKKQKWDIQFIPLRKEILNDGTEKVEICAQEKVDSKKWEKIRKQARKKYQYRLILKSGNKRIEEE